MPSQAKEVAGLTTQGCKLRQQRLAEWLREAGLEAALICDRRHVYYFSGHWSAFYHSPLLIIRADGATRAALPEGAAGNGDIAADELLFYESSRLGTLVDDQLASALRIIGEDLRQTTSWGVDLAGLVPASHREMQDLSSVMLSLRRAKDPDEVELIRHAIRACEAGYARAAEILRPGVREIEVYAEVQAAAVGELGEPIGELGNDFQSGTPGGPPRRRTVEAGELMPLDLAVTVRGYRCDLCRTFAIGGEPTDKQLRAARLVAEALEFVEQGAHVGVSCRQLFENAAQMLDGINGWRFFHHLGHGTGLSPHEAPRLNPHWDDRLAAGDLFTVEPGLYHEELRGGVRLEQNYWLTAEGLHRLSSYPLAL